MINVIKLRKCGREVYPFPWTSSGPCPWPAGYARVVIPLTEKEKLHSNKLCHVQVVKISNLEQQKALT